MSVSVSALILERSQVTDVVCPGTQLLAMLERACKWTKILRKAADLMTKAWPKAVPAWRRMLLAFKQANSNPNPFEEPDVGKAVCTYAYDRKLIDPQVPCWSS